MSGQAANIPAAASLSKAIPARLDEGDLLLVAGRPGHGKTTLGLQLLLDAARQKGGIPSDKPVELIEAINYHHQEMAETLGNPYGPNGRAVLALMGIGAA
jgi:ABC-type dipeptide/oligopeptide/nickel transport system ATPase subunit